MIKKHDRRGATRALVFEAIQWPPLAETVGVSAGLHRRQPNNRLRSTGESKPILDNVDKMLGFVPNLHRLMSISPNALSGWATMMRSFAKTLDVKTRDGIALAVSEADGCDYCLAAHSYIAGNLAKIPADEIEMNREGRSSDPKRQAAVAFAKALIETRGKVSDAQFAAVRDAGLTDANIVELIALTAQFLLTNFMNHAVQTPIDFPEVSPAKAA